MDQPNQQYRKARLHRLIDAYCDSSISDEEVVELNQQLAADGSARSEYLNRMSLEAKLCSLYQEVGHASEVASSSSCELQLANTDWAAKELSAHGLSKFRRYFSLAATIALVAIGSSWVTHHFANQSAASRDAGLQAAADGAVDHDSSAAALVTGTRNCLWEKDSANIGYGTELQSGQLLRLEAGVAELTFTDGARVILEGPSSLRVLKAGGAELLSGRVVASVPRGSANFSLRTPRLSIGDSGTQFGLVANAEGFSEVHVFEGSVRALLLGDRGETVRKVELARQDAARLVPHSSQLAFISVDAGSFVRTLANSMGPVGGLLAIEEFDYPVGPLAWQNGGFGWAGPWADIEAASDSIAAGGARTNSVSEGSLAVSEVTSLGNRCCLTAQANRIRRNLSTNIGGVFDAAGLIEIQNGVRLIGREGRTIYLSFLQRVSQTDDVFYGVELHRGDGNTNRVLCVGNGAEGHGYGITSNFNYFQEQDWELGAENTETNFFVIRIEYGDEDYDTVTVYRNPTQLDDESRCVASATVRGNYAFDRLSLANFEGNKTHEVDEIRIGTSFRAVTQERGHLEAPTVFSKGGAGVLVSELTTNYLRDIPYPITVKGTGLF